LKNLVWHEEIDVEIDATEINETWELVDLPQGKDIIGVKWVYKTKHKMNGSIERYKAGLVVKGYSQKLGIDYIETFAPIARLDTISIVLEITCQFKWKIFQLDVKPTFLNVVLDEEAFVE